MGITAEMRDAAARLVPGGRILRAHRLSGGVSADAFRLDLESADGERRRVVLRKRSAPGFKRRVGQAAVLEYEILDALHRRGFSVPEPLLAHAGSAAASAYVVVDWVDGTTEVAAENLHVALDQMAAFLVELHGVPAASLSIPGLEPIENPVLATGDYLPPELTDLRVALDGLAASWEPDRSALVHGDYWPGNVIWRSGTLAAVIDWEDACLGDPLADLAAARVELACAYGPDAMELFTTRYLTIRAASEAGRLQLGALPVWEVYVCASALATMHDWGLEPAAEAARRERTRRCFERAADDLMRIAVPPGSRAG